MERQMTPTITPADALARLASGPFEHDGYFYDMGSSQPYGPVDMPYTTHDATGAQFCPTGEPGTPITDADTWVLV
jgi:hypothetical protein